MKKILGFLVLMLTGGLAHADLFDYVRDKSVSVHYNQDIAAAVTSTSVVIIDLSDTTNWPHKDNGAINISSIKIEVDKAAASTTTVRLGVVNFVNTSTGSVTWFYTSGNELNVSNTANVNYASYGEGFLRTKAVQGVLPADGTTPYIISNEKTSGSTIYQRDVKLPSLISTGVLPDTGDIIMDVTKSGAAANITIDLIYFSDKR